MFSCCLRQEPESFLANITHALSSKRRKILSLPSFLIYNTDSNSTCLEMPPSIKILGLTSGFLVFLYIISDTFSKCHKYVCIYSTFHPKRNNPHPLCMHREEFPSFRKLKMFCLINHSGVFPVNVSMNCQRIQFTSVRKRVCPADS